MKAIFTSLLLLTSTFLLSQTNYQQWKWAKSFGGPGNDTVVSMKIKNGFLYVAGIYSSPQINWDGTTLNNNGGSDIFLAKMDTSGNTIWVKSFGGAGLDSLSQMEINNNGAVVLQCKSLGSSVTAGSFNLVNPANFYITVNTAGSVASAVALPGYLAYESKVGNYIFSDIDIDADGSVYVASRYFQPFSFAGTSVDTFMLTGNPWPVRTTAGAAVLKYSANGTPTWFKAIQNINRYAGVAQNVPAPIDSIGLQIEYNAADSALIFVGTHYGVGYLDSTALDSETGPTAYSKVFYVKLGTDGVTKLILPNYTGTSSRSSNVFGFEVASNGSFYHTVNRNTLSTFNNFVERKHDAVLQSSLNIFSFTAGTSVEFGQNTMVPDETGNYLLVNRTDAPFQVTGTENDDISIYDAALNFVKRSFIPEKDRLSLGAKAMYDTNAVYFASPFLGTLTLNDGLPSIPAITLNNLGSQDIMVGQYSFAAGSPSITLQGTPSKIKTCSDSVRIALQVSNSGAGNLTYHWQPGNIFSDSTILNPLVYSQQDSVPAQLTITDGAGATLNATILIFKGFVRDLRAVATPAVACYDDSITVSLQGTYFEPVYINGPGGQLRYFTDINSTVKYRAIASYEPLYYVAYPSDNCPLAPVPVIIHPKFHVYDTATICSGSSFTFPDGSTTTNITSTIIHDSRLSTINGCDSIVTTRVTASTILSPTRSDTISVCYGGDYTFPDGFALPNIMSDTLHISILSNTTGGCDSTIRTFVTVRPVITSTVTANICSGSNFTFPDGSTQQNIVSDISQTSHLATATGCDSSIITQLHVYPSFQATLDTTVCIGSSFTFPDGFVASNITSLLFHVSHFTSQQGCDSSIATTVNLYPNYSAMQQNVVCTGGSFTFPDGFVQQNITSAMTYTSHLQTIHGCDSVIITSLDIRSTTNDIVNQTVCKGTSVTYPDGTTVFVTTNTEHISHFTNVFGCDSSITSRVSVIVTDTSVTKTGLDLSSNNSGAMYQWIDCTSQTAIASATAQLFRATAVGSYAVAVTKDGCTDTSTCYPITNVDILGGRIGQITLFPVPANNNLTILFQSETATELFATLISPSGTSNRQTTFTLTPGVNTINYPLNNLLPGLYSIRFFKADTQEVIIKKFIKR